VTLAFVRKSLEAFVRPSRSTPSGLLSRRRPGDRCRSNPTVSTQAKFAGLREKLFPAAIALIASAVPFAAQGYAATAAPVFSPASGAYHTVEKVTITDATSGAVIYYTTDGTRPTTSSARYTGPFTISASTSYHALAIAGGSTSADVVGWYTIDLPTPAPTASVASGTYNQIQYVTLSDGAPNATIYYTLDGTYPSTSSTKYTGPIKATTNTNITAVASAPSYEMGPALRVSYTIVAPPPVITPSSGVVQESATISMSDAVSGAQIHWTNDGTLPTASSLIYYNPIVRSQAQTVTAVYQAMATAPGYLPSATTLATFIVAQPAGTLASTTINTTPTKTIPGTFLGISLDWQQPITLLGMNSTGANTAFQTLIKNLQVGNSSPMNFRIVGDESQLSDIESIVEPLADFAAAVNVNYTLGVDLWNNNLGLAESEAEAWKAGIPNKLILGIEIGNEPDVYPYNTARTRSYKFPQYVAQYQEWASGIKSSTGLAVVGPSMGQETNWVANTESELASGGMTPAIVTQHGYVGGATQNGDGAGSAWPLDELMAPAATTAMPKLFAGYAADAHKAGRLFRMNEINSFWGGIEGISNTFQSSLWSVDLMFNYLQSGVDGVNWNDDDAAYQFATYVAPKNNSAGMAEYQITQVFPLYYGLLVFSQMANNGGKLLPVTTTTSANVSVWATVDNSSTVHAIVINKDENATGKVTIYVPGYTTGTVRYLTAAGYWATNGVTLGGQTFDGSTDGKIQGNLTTTTIASPTGHFAIGNMPIECAAVIDFNK
jgi:hypothetical protein